MVQSRAAQPKKTHTSTKNREADLRDDPEDPGASDEDKESNGPLHGRSNSQEARINLTTLLDRAAMDLPRIRSISEVQRKSRIQGSSSLSFQFDTPTAQNFTIWGLFHTISLTHSTQSGR